MVDHLLGSGHITFDEIGWTERRAEAVWISGVKRYKALNQAHPECSLVGVIDPGDTIGDERIHGISSVVPWTLYEEYLVDTGLDQLIPTIGRNQPHADYVASLGGLCAKKTVMTVVTTMDVGGWALVSEMAQTHEITAG